MSVGFEEVTFMVIRRGGAAALALAALWACDGGEDPHHLLGAGAPAAAASTAPDAPPAADAGATPSADAAAPQSPPPSARDAGATPIDSGAPNASADAGVAALGCAGAKVCEDFETYAAGGQPGAPWQVDVASAALAVDDAKAFSGAKSLHITTNGGGAMALIAQTTPLLPLSGNTIYGRFMMFYDVMPTTHYHLVMANSADGSGQMTMGGVESSKALFNYGPGDNTAVSTTTYPAGRWACIQWEFDGPNGAARMWIDGKALDNPVSNWQAFDVAKLSVGLLNCCDDAPKVDMWIDALAIDDKSIACPN